ncbi:hypothetical protein O181_040636 [Austropuccinia psidii MF-1]|uniref:Integrase catalytic domain-containing protein n=1 Tax=Austropuccinia psidii MF-1 TaxID=1389203 RepID=A0A9Q3HDK2_9BASI|nr:hypothetical protein [Austropuccinia psidii MF-1]
MALGVCNLSLGLSILDSGTSNTINPFKQLFVKTWASKEKLQAANGSNMCVTAKSTFRIKTSEGSLNIPNSLLAPSATSTLVAMGPFLNEGAVLRGYPGGANLFCKKGKLLLKAQLINNILVIDTEKIDSTNAISSSDFLLLHKRLGNPGREIASKMLPKYNLSGVACNSCMHSKSHQLTFPGKFPLPSDVLKVVHMDVCGPISPPTQGGNWYIFQIVNGHSRIRFTFPIKLKADFYYHFSKFQRMAETQTGVKIKTVVSDKSGEFINKDFLKLFEKSRIIHLPTAPYTPQQNLVAERANRSLLEKTQVLLLDYQVPVEWWGEACSMETYLLN